MSLAFPYPLVAEKFWLRIFASIAELRVQTFDLSRVPETCDGRSTGLILVPTLGYDPGYFSRIDFCSALVNHGACLPIVFASILPFPQNQRNARLPQLLYSKWKRLTLAWLL